MTSQNQPEYSFEETNDSIRFSIRNRKDWAQFIIAVVSLLSLVAVILFMIVRLIDLLLGGVAPGTTPDATLVFLISGLVLLIVLSVTGQSVNNAFLQEDIEITGRSITVERSGFLGLRRKKVIPVENIKGISLMIQLSADNSSLGDLLMNTTKIGKLVITTRQRMMPIYRLCRGISTDEVRQIVDKILNKFPQYKYI
ncbi:MAG: hypothetical protein WBV22_04775 [Anaerolineaceae bacterium]